MAVHERSYQKLPGRAVACLYLDKPTPSFLVMPTETQYKILKHIEVNPRATQRELAAELGDSVGKVNYCLKALIDKGWVKANNFKNNPSKLGYLYLLTPLGIAEKAKLTVSFLQRKLHEHERITLEIEQLQKQLEQDQL